MIIDPAEPRDWRQYSFTIIGSGFAGLFLAEKLAAVGKVLVVEAGPLDDPLALGQGYYEIASSGIATPRLGTRLSAFGGTSNHWTGQSRPFSPRIFENRPELGIAGWPISYREFAHYLPEAQRFLNLPDYDDEQPGGLEQGLLAGMHGLSPQRFYRAQPLAMLGFPGTRETYLDHPQIDVMASSRVVDLTLAPNGDRVASIDVLLPGARTTQTIPLDTLLLCAGAIENARLMLWAGRKYPAGNPLLGGPNELTGKYFAEHPVHMPLDLYFDSRVDLSAAMSHETSRGLEYFAWMPTDALLEQHALLRFAALLDEEGLALEATELDRGDASYFGRPYRQKVVPPVLRFEQTPIESSRVCLAEERDRDGFPLARLNWEVSVRDTANYRRSTLLLASLLSQTGLVRARLIGEYRNPDWTGIQPTRSSHHTGTTRMAHSAALGVVDPDCRVFNLANMYVAGSSVFPTADYLNPTLNFLALAARLAERLTGHESAGRTAYRFGAGRLENRYLVSGWSHAEEHGLWTDGPEVGVTIPGSRGTRLRLRGRPYRGATVVLTINGREIYNGPATHLGTSKYAADQVFTIDPAEMLDIRLFFSNLTPPQSVGESDDRRQLGYFLQWLEIW